MPVISTIPLCYGPQSGATPAAHYLASVSRYRPPVAAPSEAGVYFRFDYFFFAFFRVVLRLAASTFDLLRRSAACARL